VPLAALCGQAFPVLALRSIPLHALLWPRGSLHAQRLGVCRFGRMGVMDRWRKHASASSSGGAGDAEQASAEGGASDRPRLSSAGSARSSERCVPEEAPNHPCPSSAEQDSPTSAAVAAAAAAAVGVYGQLGRGSASGERPSSPKERCAAGNAGTLLGSSSFGRAAPVHSEGEAILPARKKPEDPLLPARTSPTDDEEANDQDASSFAVHDEDCESEAADADAPLVIQADASLVDGLRALLVHHLKRSVGANIVNLSASQAELLEHHLARLASYATKIVHTLAFATRFLSKHAAEQDAEPDGNHQAEAGVPQSVGTGASSASRAPAPPEVAAAETKPPKKALKLNDAEILSLYQSAQMEAAIEADWRGISAPRNDSSFDGRTSSSHRSMWSGSPAKTPHADFDKSGDQEYLRMLSRAMQQPGRSPRTFTAEILEPSRDVGTVCCAPRLEGGSMFKVVSSHRSSALPPPSSTPDPGSHRGGSHRVRSARQPYAHM